MFKFSLLLELTSILFEFFHFPAMKPDVSLMEATFRTSCCVMERQKRKVSSSEPEGVGKLCSSSFDESKHNAIRRCESDTTFTENEKKNCV